jgi:hypothetical protein
MSTLTTTTSATRPNLGTGDVGKSYFETDSNKILAWDGTAWNEWNSDLVLTPGFDNNFTAALDGTNDYLSIPASTDFDFGTGNFSFTFWMRVTSREAYGGLFSKGLSYRLKFQNSDSVINLSMSTEQAGIINHGSSLLGAWHHIMIVRNGSSLTGYVDGSLSATKTLTTETMSGSGNALVWGDNAGSAIGGQLDEISIFDRALSPTERTEIYNNGTSFDIGSAYTGADAPLAFYRCGDDGDDTDNGGGTVGNGDIIGTIKNVVNPGTHDMSQVNGATYSNANSPV